VLDPQIYPPKEGCSWVADPASEAGAGGTWDGTAFTAPPLPPSTPREIEEQQREDRVAQLKAQSDVVDLANRLKNSTPAEIDAWIDNNVGNLAQARAVLKAMLKVMAYTSRQ
jgi:hypothetical protein